MSGDGPERQDLIVLVADNNTRYSFEGLLSRPEALGIHRIQYEVRAHPERDPGCWLRSPEFLHLYRNRFRFALVILDREGSGQEERSRQDLESELEERLGARGWAGRCAAVVIDPELEVWVWSDSPHVDEALGWGGRSPDLRAWLQKQHLLDGDSTKPKLPKRAVEKALWEAKKPRSSTIYREIAAKVSFQRCQDPALHKLLDTLRSWFSAGAD